MSMLEVSTRGLPSISQSSEARYLNSFIRGMAVTQMLGVACETGLPDAVPHDEAVELATLANELDVEPGALSRLARALCSFGFFDVDAGGRISHNACSRMLRSAANDESAPSQHWAARFWRLPGVWQAWASLGHSLRSGGEAFQPAHGQQFFSYMREHPEEAQVYRAYMAGGYPGRHEAIASLLKFNPDTSVVDVGGGNGALGKALLQRYPDLRYMVYDQPEVVRNIDSPAMLAQAGNFFESVPMGGDVYVLSWILHDWPDERALEILASCRKAMNESARLVIVERLIHPSPAECDPFDLLLDINMLVLHGGKERSQHEFNELLGRAGFAPLVVVGKKPGFAVFETRAVGQ